MPGSAQDPVQVDLELLLQSPQESQAGPSATALIVRKRGLRQIELRSHLLLVNPQELRPQHPKAPADRFPRERVPVISLFHLKSCSFSTILESNAGVQAQSVLYGGGAWLVKDPLPAPVAPDHG